MTELRSWEDYHLPAGFRGGLCAAVFAPGGRHIGFLTLPTDFPSGLGPADREVGSPVRVSLASTNRATGLLNPLRASHGLRHAATYAPRVSTS